MGGAALCLELFFWKLFILGMIAFAYESEERRGRESNPLSLNLAQPLSGCFVRR